MTFLINKAPPRIRPPHHQPSLGHRMNSENKIKTRLLTTSSQRCKRICQYQVRLLAICMCVPQYDFIISVHRCVSPEGCGLQPNPNFRSRFCSALYSTIAPCLNSQLSLKADHKATEISPMKWRAGSKRLYSIPLSSLKLVDPILKLRPKEAVY